MRNRIFFKLVLAFGVVILVAVAMLGVFLRRSWSDALAQEVKLNLTQKTLLFANRVNIDRQHNIQDIASQEGQAAGARATVIDAQGLVLADSETMPGSMENQSMRPEFVSALKGELGTDIRLGKPLQVPVLFVSAPISGGAVRLAYPLSDSGGVPGIWRDVLLASGSAFVVAVAIAAFAARTMNRRLQKIAEFASRLSEGELSARVDDNAGDEIGLVLAALDRGANDIEERFLALRTSQRQLETLLNSMQDAVIAIGADERVQWANQSMDRLVPQRTRLQAPLVETVRDPDFLRAVRGASETRRVSTARAISILPGRTFEVTAAPMPAGGSVAVLRDLTETERVEKTRRDFIANVSHELRTPLTSIQGYTETLLDTSPESNHSRDFLEIIRKNATRMSRLTEDLLTLARVESGEQRFDTQPVLSAELLQEAVQSFRELARVHEVELAVENEAPGPVSADREAIHQVFSNLVDNALKYGGSGHRVVLGARPAGSNVEFYVRDSGPGIPSEHLPRLFERFYRVDKARSRESGGTGLGLAIAKHIVLAHGGTIRAESELNHGSTFLFALPLAGPVSEADPG